MHVSQILTRKLAAGQPTFSCEFFPPKTPDGETVLAQTISDLLPYKLDFVSLTYGAGGSTQATSLRIVREIIAQTGLPTIAHLTCVGATASELDSVIDQFQAAGVRNILALRGDPVAGPGSDWVTTPGGYTYAVELVSALAARGEFSIGVSAFPSGHPESKSLDDDAKVLAMKQQAGADFALTNLFFEAEHYFDMLQRSQRFGCSMPIVPGLMPLTNVSQIERFTAMSGAEFPAELAAKFRSIADEPNAVRELGVQVVTELARELLAGGAPGIHLYGLNRSDSVAQVLSNLQAS